jgi:hypothetical protein
VVRHWRPGGLDPAPPVGVEGNRSQPAPDLLRLVGTVPERLGLVAEQQARTVHQAAGDR